MAVDNTHTKYLKGADKKAWSNYKDALESQRKLENFMDGFDFDGLKEGEEMEIPIRSKQNNNNAKNQGK